MDISVGATVDANPEVNISMLLKMINTAGSESSIAMTKNTGDDGNNAENGNNFFQILDQQIVALLQAGETGISQQLATKEDLSMALEKLLQEDQNASGEVLSEFALLAIAGKLSELYAGENELSEKTSSSLIAGTGLTGILKDEISANIIQMLVPAGLEKAAGTNGNENNNSYPLSGFVPEENDGAQAEKSGNDKGIYILKAGEVLADESSFAKQSDNLFNKNAANQSIISDMKEKGIAELNIKEKPIQTQPQGPTTLLKDMQTSDPTGYGDAESNIVAEVQDKVRQLRNTDGISSLEKASVDSSSNKSSVNVTGVVPENKNRLNLSNELKIDDENLSAQSFQDQTGEDMKKKISAKQDVSLADRQTNPSSDNAQKSTTGKIAAIPDEIVTMIDKIKTEAKGKTSTVEKYIESNSLNSSNVSGVSTAKTATSEISPSQLISRVAAEFHENLVNEGGRVKITLTPPSLGTLDMDVVVRNGKVEVILTADNKDVQRMLSGNLDSLKGSLQSQGLTIERCDVMMQDRREQHQQGFSQQAFNQDRTNSHNDNHRKNDNREIKPAGLFTKATGVPHHGVSGIDKISLFV